ncbi:P-loop containing nucleoside triphosphate hydrolase protein, partial [Xylaria intraflava]
ARAGQVAAVERLAYRNADTVLVAATGYGKSAVLYAFAAITGRITIQIVPLTQLGQAQLEDIARDVAGSSPNKNIWEEIQAGKYSHVLLSPEQALNPQFKAILRSPEFHSRIGLFAIDELHVVQEWRDFRKDFTYLHTLRSLLPRRVPWFGCTATLERDHEEFILEHAGVTGRLRQSDDSPENSAPGSQTSRRFGLDRNATLFPEGS